MTHGIKNSPNSFHDVTHGGYGFMIWVLPFGVMFFFYFLFIGILLLVTTNPSLSEDYLGIWFGVLVMLTIVIWLGSSTFYALKTVQSIKFQGNTVFISLYFCRKIKFDLEDIDKIHDLKINKLMSQTRTFPAGGIGLSIYLNSGKKYLISPNIKGFIKIKELFQQINDARPQCV